MLRDRVYNVDTAKGIVLGQNGKPLQVTVRTQGVSSYYFVELYHKPSDKRRKISVSIVVWMAGTRSTVPRNFEIHHRDLDTSNNAFDNLFCLHKSDHLKLHSSGLIDDGGDSGVPF